MTECLQMADLDLANQRVMIREDLNVPLQSGCITNDERIKRALPTLKQALQQQARVTVLSHLGRPQEGQFDAEFSLQPVADYLSEALGQPVPLIRDWREAVAPQPGELVLYENLRFNRGEKNNDPALAAALAAQCDVFVMDAFAVAHRAQASTVGLAQCAQKSVIGPLFQQELQALTSVLDHPRSPRLAIVGGAKVSSKMSVLMHLLDKVDVLVLGGGIMNTLLAARGYAVGASLYESDWLPQGQDFLEQAARKNVQVPFPIDVCVATQFSKEASAVIKSIEAIAPDDMILDVGPKTAALYAQLISQAATILWNGPVGVFEFPAFAAGTRTVAQAVAESAGYSVAGGGDTIAALAAFNVLSDIDYVSTGGGAFLTLLEGEPLPVLEWLTKRDLI